MPAGSKMDLLLAKAKPISHGGSASGVTCLRRKEKEQQLLQPERRVRRCEKLCRHQEGKSREEYGNRPVQSLLFETYFISEIEDENGKEMEQVQ
ncbi:A disintegrin and metalloproteinase with thrombospondin motifs 6 [Grus japonensis]|uniref:A disintegrin and metalloproteinase with thrombospondin motifs 6 n=1 Tax=Grus japonensis TaxID=30415 RepID=A0ABC9Y233_GRUJA